MYTLLRLLLRRPWGWLIVGIVLVIGGMVWGLTSHQVAYQNSSQSASYHYTFGDTTGNLYVMQDGTSNYFVGFSGSFSPSLSQSTIDNSGGFTFVARTDTSSLNPPLSYNGTTVNDAYQIEKLVVYDKSNNVEGTYTTSDYQSNPSGFYDNEWLKAIWLVLGGLLVVGLSIFLMVRGRGVSTNAGFSINASGAIPYQPPMQTPNPYAPGAPATPYGQPQVPYTPPAPGAPYGQPPAPYAPPAPPANPYGQAYQGPGQYPAQAPTYPPQPPYPPQQ